MAPLSKGTSQEALCCCEYDNMSGERSHILACCCDCEALDQAFDRCLTCRRIPSPIMNRLIDVISDRCRFPGVVGSGAIKVRLDLFLPIVVVPLSLAIATIGPITTFLVLTTMPLFMLFFYRNWRRNTKKTRSPFFFIWGMMSCFVLFVIFEAAVIPYREVLLWENVLLGTAGALMLNYMYRAKNVHGQLRSSKYSNTTKSYSKGGNQNQDYDVDLPMSSGNAALKEYTEINVNINADESSGHDEYATQVHKYPQSLEQMTAESLSEKEVTWVDSRPIIDGQLKTWCTECRIKKPPRSGHCNVCKECFNCRDHHCVWINCCIGSHNHRPFLAAMALCVFCGFYGVQLSMTTICTPEMYLEWFLVPNDCRFLYIDFQSAISFVGAMYAFLCSCIMLVGFLHQLLMISQNITSQELNQASKRGMTRCYGLVATNNIHNHGFIRNWLEFLFTNRNKT